MKGYAACYKRAFSHHTTHTSKSTLLLSDLTKASFLNSCSLLFISGYSSDSWALDLSEPDAGSVE